MIVADELKLVQVVSEDQLTLNGLLKERSSRSAIVFIHGFTGDFYAHKFIHSITNRLATADVTVLLAQTRGTGIATEFLVGAAGLQVGSAYEKLEDAHLDISAFVALLEERGFDDIYLVGHSLGTVKTVRYLAEGSLADKIAGIVLLAPFDKNAYIERKLGPLRDEYLQNATAKVAAGEGAELVPVPEYEDFQMSFATYASWYTPSVLNAMWDFYDKEAKFEALTAISVPTLAILGDKDPYVDFPEFDVDAKRALEIIEEQVAVCSTELISNCDHCFRGHEDKVAQLVTDFIGSNK